MTAATEALPWLRGNIYKARAFPKGMQIDIPGGLRELASVADRLAALLEWEKLAEQERGSRSLPPFRLRDYNCQDIIDLYGRFLNLSTSITKVLERAGNAFPPEQTDIWWRQLRTLGQRVHGFGIIDRFIKP